MSLEEVKSISISCIYRITFPNGKCYVGQTVDLGSRVRLCERCMSMKTRGRVSDALREFGIENVSWDVLRAVSVDDKDDLKLCLSILEIKYIRENDCIFPKGYNTSIGGEILNIPAEVIDMKFGVEAGGYASKPVLVYDADGVLISEHPSVARCAYDLGTTDSEIQRCLDKVLLVRGSYMVREKRYGYAPEKIAPYEPKVSVRHRTKTEYEIIKEKVYKKVEIKNAAIMYNKDGEYVGLFDNDNQVRHFLRLDNTFQFGRECHGMYIFHYNGGEVRKSIGRIRSKAVTTIMYDDILALGDADNIGELISLPEAAVVKVRKTKPVKEPKIRPRIEKYTLDGKYICTYKDMQEAAYKDNVLVSSVYACAKKINRRCGNFIYRFEGDDLDLPDFSTGVMKRHLKK